MGGADHLDPHAPGVVNVRRERAHRAAWRPGNRLRPQLSRKVFNEVGRDAIVRAPRSDQFLSVLVVFRHASSIPRQVNFVNPVYL